MIRFVGMDKPGQMDQIKVAMVEVSDGKNGKTLVDLTLDASYKWEGYNPKTVPVAVVGKPFPELKFTSADGREIDVAKLKGKVVLVDFWATWCGPCKAEMPHLIEAYAACKDKGFEIVGISLDQDMEAMNRYLKEQKITWPQYFDGKGWDNAIAKRFHMQAIPCCYLLDRDGIVRYDRPLGSQLKETVQKLCDSAPPEKAGQAGQWETDFAKASARAQKEGKYLLMDFSGSDWCGWCMKLEREVFSQKAFQDYAAENLVLMLVDFPRSKPQSQELKQQNAALALKCNIQGYPTVILMDPHGKVAGETGYQPGGPEAYVEHLKALIAKHKAAGAAR